MTVDLRWWLSTEPHNAIQGVVERIESRQSYRSDAFLHYARLYAGAEIDGLSIDSYASTAGGRYTPSDITFNVVKNLSDTLTAKVTKSRPLPMFLTTGGDWSAQKKAKALGTFVEGMFDQCKVFSRTTGTALDAVVHGTGFVYPYEDGETIHLETVHPWEISVDDVDAASGEPRCIYRTRYIDRTVLAEQFPEHRDKIMSFADTWRRFGADYSHDMVAVRAAWHLRSSATATDGKYVLCISNATLHESEWTRDYFPFPKLTMMPPPAGYFGIGLGEMLTGIQYEINFTAMRIQKAHEMMGGAHWFVQAGSIEPKMLDNGHGTVWTGNGSAPIPIVPQPIHPDAYQYLEMLKRYASEVCGVSQMSASSQKPAGLNSGKALQVYDDIESERFIVFGRCWEDFHMEIARQMIDLARDLAEKNPAFATKAKKSGMLRELKFRDVDLAETDYTMQVFPTSALAKTPAAKMQQVQDLFSMQLIGADQCKRLLDFPDLEDAASLDSASFDLASGHIESMLDDGETRDPVPEMNLEESYRLVNLSIVRAAGRGCPEENLDLARRYASILQQWMPQPAPPPPDAAPMPPPEAMAA